MKEPIRQAWLDFAHDWRVSVCLVLALAAVLAPLLVLFGLRYGVVDTMRGRLVEDARNREILPIGSGAFTESWIAALRERPDVAFVLPRTRSIAASMKLVAAESRRLVDVDLMASAAGDPILGEKLPPPTGSDRIILSHNAALKLEVESGDQIQGFVTRVRNGLKEHAAVSLEVGGVLPLRITSRAMAWVSLDLLVATEDFRDGKSVAAFDAGGAPVPDGERAFAGFRLYANSIYDVPILRRHFEGEGIEVRTQASDIESLMALDGNLGRIFWMIATVAIAGCAASLAVSLWASVERKRSQISVLRLLGLARYEVMLVPVSQAAMTAFFGGALAIITFAGVAAVINRSYESDLAAGEFLCILEAHHFVIAILATLAIATASAAFATYRAARIEPGEGLRLV